MHLPVIKKENRYRRSIVNFGGLNLSQSFKDGELRDCVGISHSEFPFITQRKKRETEFKCAAPTCAIFGENEFVAADDGLYFNRKKVGDLSPGKKHIAALGSFITVFPDKMYYNMENGEFKSLSGECQTQGATVKFTTDTISVTADYFVEERSRESIKFPSDILLVTYEKASVSDGKVGLTGFSLKKPNELGADAILFEKCKVNQ